MICVVQILVALVSSHSKVEMENSRTETVLPKHGPTEVRTRYRSSRRCLETISRSTVTLIRSSRISQTSSCQSPVVMKALSLRGRAVSRCWIVNAQFPYRTFPVKISSPRCQCMRRLVESVLPTTRNANGARHTNGATAADITQSIADPAMSMPSPVRVMTHP